MYFYKIIIFKLNKFHKYKKTTYDPLNLSYLLLEKESIHTLGKLILANKAIPGGIFEPPIKILPKSSTDPHIKKMFEYLF